MTKYDLAIELGSCNTTIYKCGVGVVLNEPTLLLLQTENKQTYIREIGYKAKKLTAKVADDYEVVEPVRDGVIVNKEYAKTLLKEFLNMIGQKYNGRTSVVFLIPTSISPKDKNEFRNLGFSLGFRNVSLLPSALSALAELEVETSDPYCHMLVNMGGDVTDIAVVHQGRIVQGCTIDLGGKLLDNSVRNRLQENYNMYVSQYMAEQVRKELSTLLPNDTIAYTFSGTAYDNYGESETTINAQELRPVYMDFFGKICGAIESVLNLCKGEIISDINKMGIYLTGGLSQFTGLDRYMRSRLNVSVYCAPEAESTILGMAKLFNEPETLNELIMKNK